MPKPQNWQVTLTVQQAADLYEEHEGTPLFASMCEAMTTGPLIALALEMKDAQAVWLKMLGPDDPAVAKEEVSPTPLPLLTCPRQTLAPSARLPTTQHARSQFTTVRLLPIPAAALRHRRR